VISAKNPLLHLPPTRFIHVVAAVIMDARGRVLLNRRRGDSDLPGLWEFAGGKCEPGETPQQALTRELREELGIEAQIGPWLMDIAQCYPDKRLRLSVYRVAQWKGIARGREGQAITWVNVDKLTRYCMPPADQPVIAALTQPDRYLVTPEPKSLQPSDIQAWLDALDRVIAGGIEWIHLRLPTLPAPQRRVLTRRTVQRFAKRAQLFVHRDIELARELNTGVHLGSQQLMQLTARSLPKHLPVAASCHDLQQLKTAQQLGCDFVVLGPVQATHSHPDAKPLGWAKFEQLREQVSLPIYAIGGLKPSDIVTARQHGAQGIAAIGALWNG